MPNTVINPHTGRRIQVGGAVYNKVFGGGLFKRKKRVICSKHSGNWQACNKAGCTMDYVGNCYKERNWK